MKKEEIEAKLSKLDELYKKLKALRTSKGEVFNEEAENLLSQAQLIEEALKNYMYHQKQVLQNVREVCIAM